MPPKRDVPSLRDQGNAAYKAEKWEESIELYSRAIVEDASIDDPAHMAALYCNRSAAYSKRCEFDLAILDARVAEIIQPRWYRPPQRAAEAHRGLHMFGAAAQDYEDAADVLETNPGPDYANHGRLIATLEAEQGRMEQALHAGPKIRTAADTDYFARAKTFRPEELKDRIAARAALRGLEVVFRNWDDFVRDEGKLQVGRHDLDTLWNVLDVAYETPEAFCFRGRNADGRAIGKALHSALARDLTSIEELVSLCPVDRMDDFAEKVDAVIDHSGWEALNGGKEWLNRYLGLTLIHALKQKFSAEFDEAIRTVRTGLKLAESMLELRPELQHRVARIIHQCESFVLECYSWLLEDDGKITLHRLDQFTTLSESCFDYVIRRIATMPAQEDDVLNLVRRNRPLARFLYCQALGLRTRAHQKENHEHRIKNIVWPNSRQLKAAAALALKAADFLPEDDENKCKYIDFAIRCQIAVGGSTPRQLFNRQAAGERSRSFSEAFFGPIKRRTFDHAHNRNILRVSVESIAESINPILGTYREEIRAGLPTRQTHLDSGLDYPLKPAAVVFGGTTKEFDRLWANEPAAAQRIWAEYPDGTTVWDRDERLTV
ncbi:hypothetical protein JCM11491_006121 [Sporobolomyces phaffii]